MKKRKTRQKKYAILDVKTGKLRTAIATNYIKASKKLGISSYELRTYGHIMKGKY